MYVLLLLKLKLFLNKLKVVGVAETVEIAPLKLCCVSVGRPL